MKIYIVFKNEEIEPRAPWACTEHLFAFANEELADEAVKQLNKDAKKWEEYNCEAIELLDVEMEE
ncbi:MAG: hypothetical protein JRD89_05130 [Deltaproteobacteria bacterium]|nr:hypothetical protein [Deltaproteobacteria bacterium]